MDSLKNSLAGMGAYGIGMNGTSFGWVEWVTTVLFWTLMLVAILAIGKYISHN